MNINQFLQPLNDALGPLIKQGFAAPLNLTPGLVVLEVSGRKTGRARSVPLVAYLAYPYLAVGTVRSNSQWIKNLRAEDHPHLWLWGHRFGYDKVMVTDQWVIGRLEDPYPV